MIEDIPFEDIRLFEDARSLIENISPEKGSALQLCDDMERFIIVRLQGVRPLEDGDNLEHLCNAFEGLLNASAPQKSLSTIEDHVLTRLQNKLKHFVDSQHLPKDTLLHLSEDVPTGVPNLPEIAHSSIRFTQARHLPENIQLEDYILKQLGNILPNLRIALHNLSAPYDLTHTPYQPGKTQLILEQLEGILQKLEFTVLQLHSIRLDEQTLSMGFGCVVKNVSYLAFVIPRSIYPHPGK